MAVQIQIDVVSCDPPSPKAGYPFTLTVTLHSAEAKAVLVKLEKQRLVPGGGAFQTAPTGSNYFVSGFDPKPIQISAGATQGTSDPIKVRTDAESDDQPPVRVKFPDYVIFTAYTDSPKNGVPLMVTIQGSPVP
jgi:hypothetical protein